MRQQKRREREPCPGCGGEMWPRFTWERTSCTRGCGAYIIVDPRGKSILILPNEET